MELWPADKRKRLILQAKEVGVFAFLFVVRIRMIYLADALSSLPGQPLHGLKAFLHSLASVQYGNALVVGVAVFAYPFLSLTRGRLIPRKFLDFLGIWMVVNLVFHFLKINLLLFTPTRYPELLLGQLIAFVVFFVVAWGWIYWRVDCAEYEGSAGILEVKERGETLSMFDYMYSSLYAIQKMGYESNISGSTRLGRILVSIHNFMVLDLVAIGLGRFYQLIKSTL